MTKDANNGHEGIDMAGKVCLVTGATAGIGAETARGLAALGATVILVGRRPDRGAEVRERIKRETGNQHIEFIPADLSIQAKIVEMAEEVKQRHDHLDVLINNVGAIFARRVLSRDGIEMTFALNHLSYFMVTNLLLDLIAASAPARIVNVSSAAHHGARIHFDDLQFQHGYFAMTAYGQSKLANLLFTYELARRLEGSGVTVNALHPGFIASNFGHNNPGMSGFVIRLSQLFAASPQKGAETSIYLATSAEVEGMTGKYFVNKKPVPSSPESYDQEAAKRLWEISEEMTGLKERRGARSG